MKAIPILFALLASSMAAGQTQPPAEPKPKAPLNLKLDDAPRAAAPRINFENPDEKAAKSTLPSLGEGARSVEPRPARQEGGGASPFPKDTNPSMR